MDTCLPDARYFSPRLPCGENADFTFWTVVSLIAVPPAEEGMRDESV